MEGRRVAAAALCCVFTMLSVSGQQQVAGLSEFCGCFGRCYPGCRKSHAGWLCTIGCAQYCTVVSHEVPAAAAFGDGDCSKICLSSVCGAAESGDGTTDAGGAAACVHDCTTNWSRYKNKHT